MRQIRQLNTAVLTALKTALDGLQRFEKEPAGPYFKTIVSDMLGGITDIDIWALRRQINEEEKRRVGSVTIRVISPGAADSIERLSLQERRVMRLTGEGHPIEAIADLLSIAPRTVSNHRSNIAAKLGLGSARELLKYAHDNLTFITADPA